MILNNHSLFSLSFAKPLNESEFFADDCLFSQYFIRIYKKER